MEKLSNLLVKLARRLFTDTEEQERFIQAIINPQPFHPCILWCQDKPQDTPFIPIEPTPWQPGFIERLSLSEKPSKHNLHTQGYFGVA